MTDDGSYGRKGLVTEGVEEVIKREKVNKCFAIGPAIMMKFVCLLTKKYEIPTDVSLNTIMVVCVVHAASPWEAKHASYAWMVLNLTDIKWISMKC